MELEVSDRVVSESATNPEVERAIDHATEAEDWYLTLSGEGDDSLEAQRESGRFRLRYSEKGVDRQSAEPVDATTAKTVLASYLAKDQSWRTRIRWVDLPPPTRLTSGGVPPPPTLRLVGTIGAIAAIVIIGLWILSDQPAIVAALPEPLDDTGTWPIALMFLAVPGIVLFVIVKKMFDIRRASSWAGAPARVTKSALVAEQVQKMGEASQVRNHAQVEYEFVIPDGHHVVGHRISLGEDADVNADATLARYPVGAAVNAYYNPSQPGDCVLERGAPAHTGLVLGIVAAVVIVAVPAIYFGIRAIYRVLEARLGEGHAPFVMFFGAAGALALVGTLGGRLLARRASTWPTVPGRVVRSTVESYEQYVNHRRTTFYKPMVEYAYTVNGREFHGRRLDYRAEVGSDQALAATKIQPFPVGQQVEVHYDPANPSEAVLKPTAGSPVVGLGLGLAFLAAAYFFAK